MSDVLVLPLTQTPGFSLALGMVVHGLSGSGHGKAEDILPRLLAAWIKILLAEVEHLHFFKTNFFRFCKLTVKYFTSPELFSIP